MPYHRKTKNTPAKRKAQNKTQENLAERCDLEGYKHDFLNINGFDVEGVDYSKDITDMSSLD